MPPINAATHDANNICMANRNTDHRRRPRGIESNGDGVRRKATSHLGHTRRHNSHARYDRSHAAGIPSTSWARAQLRRDFFGELRPTTETGETFRDKLIVSNDYTLGGTTVPRREIPRPLRKESTPRPPRLRVTSSPNESERDSGYDTTSTYKSRTTGIITPPHVDFSPIRATNLRKDYKIRSYAGNCDPERPFWG